MSESAGVAGLSRHRRRIFLILWVTYSLALAGMSLVPGASVPSEMLLGWDKLAHAVAFLVLAGLMLPFVTNRPRWPWLVLGWSVAMALVTEALQMSTPGRTFSVFDMLADVVGTVALLLAIGAWVGWRSHRASASRT